MAKFTDFFKNFFSNVKADPVSSAKGLLQLAAGGAAVYGMATGTVPVNTITTGFAATAIGSGIHALGTNSTTGVEIPAAIKAEESLHAAMLAVPMALSVIDQVAAIKKDAEAGQAAVQTYLNIAAAVAQMLPPAEPQQGIRG